MIHSTFIGNIVSRGRESLRVVKVSTTSLIFRNNCTKSKVKLVINDKYTKIYGLTSDKIKLKSAVDGLRV